MLSSLIPVDNFKNGFTTCVHLKDVDDRLVHVPLGDKVLGVHKVSSRTKHEIVSPPAPRHSSSSTALPPPTLAWEAFYPKGSINPGGEIVGGFSFYLSGPNAFASQLEEGAKEVLMSYRMMLEKDWEWVKGGKFPGFFGGIGQLAYTCTGGRQEDRNQCFDMRPMWRKDGVGELYTYLPLDEENKKVLKKVPPHSIANADYGFSVGRGAFDWEDAVGNWVTVSCRIKLNDVDSFNGEIQLWIDGKSVIVANGLSLRESSHSIIKGMHFQTFFGGHTADWASPKDQKAWFADITGVII